MPVGASSLPLSPEKRWRSVVIGLAIFIVALLPGVIFLTADPPSDLSWSLAPFTDDPAAMTPARLAVQQAKGLISDADHHDSNPFVTSLLKIVMSLLGTGLWQGRILFVMAGSLSCVLLFILVRRAAGDWAGALAGMLLATNSVFILYNRLALEETLVIFFGLVAMALARFDKPSYLNAFIVGAVIGIDVCLVKLHALVFIPALGLAAIPACARVRESSERKSWILWGGAAFGGFFAVCAVGTVLHFMPVYADFGQYFLVNWLPRASDLDSVWQKSALVSYRWDDNWEDLAGRYLSIGVGSRLFERMLLTALVGIVSGLIWLCSRRRIKDESPSRLFMLAWLAASYLGLGLLRYRPLRYELLLIPPLCAEAAIGLVFLTGRMTSEGVIAGISSCFWAWLRVPGRVRTATSILLVIACLGTQGIYYARYLPSRSYNTFSASRDLSLILPPGAIVAGPFADAVTMETTFGACPYGGLPESPAALIESYPRATHLLVPVSVRDFEKFQKATLGRQLTPVRCYIMGPHLDFLEQTKASQEFWLDAGWPQLNPTSLNVLFRVEPSNIPPPTDFERAVLTLWSFGDAAALALFKHFSTQHPDHLPTLLQVARWDRKYLERAQDVIKRGEPLNQRDIENFRQLYFTEKLDGQIP